MTKTKSTAKFSSAIAAAALAAIGMTASSSQAGTTLFWDGDGVSPQAGGAGAWDTTNARFSLTSGGTVDQIWNNTNIDSPTFDTTAGVVTLTGPFVVNQITMGVSGYTIGNSNSAASSQKITFSGAGAGINTATTGTTTFGANFAGTVIKSGPGRIEMGNGTNPTSIKYVLNGGVMSTASIARMSGSPPVALVPDFLTFNGGGWAINTGAQDTGPNRGITIKSGGAFFGQSTLGSSLTITVSSPIVGTEGGDLTITNAGPFTGNGSVTAGALLILTNTNNSWDGNAIVAGASGNILRVGASGVIPDTCVVSTNVAGNSFDLNGFTETIKGLGGTAGTTAVGAAGTLIIGNSTGQSYAGVFTGTPGGKVVKNGTGVQSLTGSSTGFTGEFEVVSGTIGVGASNALGAGAAGSTITMSGGKLSNTGTGGRTFPATAAFNIAGDFTVDDSVFTGPGNIQENGAATIKNGNRTITVNGCTFLLNGIVGEDAAGRGLIKDGTGTLSLLQAANTYSGDTTILAGKINVDGDGSLGNQAGTLKLSGGAYNVTANRTATTDNPISVTADSAITTTSAATTVEIEFTSGTVGGTGGTLTLRNDGADGAGDQLRVRFSGAGFDMPRPIVIDNGATGKTEMRSFNVFGSTQTFSGDISGNGVYRRSSSVNGNSGDTVLSGNNSYSGGTTLGDGGIGLGSDTALGTGTLTVDPNGNSSLVRLFASGGAHTVSNPVVFSGASTAALTFNGTNALTLSGTFDLGGAVRTLQSDNTTAVTELSGVVSNGGVTKTGDGTIKISNTYSYTGGTTVQAGKLVLNRLDEANAVNITGGTLQVADSSPTLPLTPSGNNASVSRPLSLAIANDAGLPQLRVYTATLDLGNNDLILDYPDLGPNPAVDTEDAVRSGFNGGIWTGTGITSSTAANVLANGNYALAVADNALLTNKFGDGSGGKPQFAGQNVDDTTVLVKFTHRVDLDLDGLVTPNDAIIFATNYIQNGNGNWITGDVDYDGKHTQNDAIIFATFYNGTLPSLPEPGIATVALGAAGLLLRRGRRA